MTELIYRYLPKRFPDESLLASNCKKYCRATGFCPDAWKCRTRFLKNTDRKPPR